MAVRNLGGRKLRSWLTMLGIFIGIAAVVSLVGMGEGLRIAITSQFGFVGSDVLTVTAEGLATAGPPGTGAPNPLSDNLAAKIEKIPGVEAAINRYLKSGTLEFNNKQGLGFAMSVPEGDNRKIMMKMLNLEAEQGRLLKDGDGRKVLLGNSYLDKSQFGKPISSGDYVYLNSIKYQVIGIMKKKGSFLFDQAVLVNTKQLLADFGDDGTTNIIAVKVIDESRIDKVKEDVEKLLRKERDVKVGEEDFSVSSPEQTLEQMNSVLGAVQWFIVILASISLVVGGIGIMNTMYTSVLERTKEIGILKSIGARNRVIFLLFFLESGFLGLVGGIIGVILGITLAYGLAYLGRTLLGADLIQASVSMGLIFGSLSFSFVIGTLAGLLPAYQASRKHPVDALRFIK
ncbi:ABC transporter permease [Candidatus Woesearchaeota archaeon]|nr:ABC transporter permease [Candidatus Woesearchaeota archaeon]